jgi:Ca2+-binding EF-hand superfamily protein
LDTHACALHEVCRHSLLTPFPAVSGPEINRLKKRFMKLDRDGSGSIDKDEFLQIPAIANNPLALRMIAIFDEE